MQGIQQNSDSYYYYCKLVIHQHPFPVRVLEVGMNPQAVLKLFCVNQPVPCHFDWILVHNGEIQVLVNLGQVSILVLGVLALVEGQCTDVE